MNNIHIIIVSIFEISVVKNQLSKNRLFLLNYLRIKITET